ncbi:hypothetical protein ACJJIU_08160 [Microbulbifer sp. CnH-101-E]|uniref:hypothetical protein n=1 Tax=unclassified Microbulbifer TaxID=2619833 RepID=UPI0040392C18
MSITSTASKISLTAILIFASSIASSEIQLESSNNLKDAHKEISAIANDQEISLAIRKEALMAAGNIEKVALEISKLNARISILEKKLMVSERMIDDYKNLVDQLERKLKEYESE